MVLWKGNIKTFILVQYLLYFDYVKHTARTQIGHLITYTVKKNQSKHAS